MRLGSVMSVMEVIQPIWSPLGSSRGETYMRAVKREPSRRCASTSSPLLGVLPEVSTSSVCWCCSWRPGTQYGKGGLRPIRSASFQPIMRQNAGLT